MIRTSSEAINAYLSTSETDRVKILIRLSFDLTIVARDLTSSDDISNKERLPGLSEIQHIALSQALSILSGDPHRYPDADLIPVLVKTAERFGLANRVQESLSKYLSQLNEPE